MINYEFTIMNKMSLIYFLNPDFFCPQINIFFAKEECLDKRINPGIPKTHPCSTGIKPPTKPIIIKNKPNPISKYFFII